MLPFVGGCCATILSRYQGPQARHHSETMRTKPRQAVPGKATGTGTHIITHQDNAKKGHCILKISDNFTIKNVKRQL